MVIDEFTNKFSQTNSFKQSLRLTFTVDVLNESHISIGLNTLLRIQDSYLAGKVKQCDKGPNQYNQQRCAASEAKIRYVAGMCVGRVMFHTTEYICRNILTAKPQLDDKKDLLRFYKKHVYNSILIAKLESQCIGNHIPPNPIRSPYHC